MTPSPQPSLPDLRKAIRSIIREHQRTDHPSSEALLAYALKTLPEESVETLQDHLACCSKCSQIILLMVSEPQEEMWEELGTRLHEPEVPRDVSFEHPRARGRWARPSQVGVRRFWLAAALLLATIGLSVLTTLQHREILEYQEILAVRPVVIQTYIADLAPAERTLRGREDPNEAVPIMDVGLPYVLILNSTAPPLSGGYRAEIANNEGRVLYSLSNLETGSSGEVSLGISNFALPEGLFRLTLYHNDEAGQKLATYNFRIVKGRNTQERQ
jgi:hypothetical protein